MPSINLHYTRKKGFKPDEPDANYKYISKKDLEKFNPVTLGLGNLESYGKKVEALTAIFDLQGFTSFCNQMEPHLVVPQFLSQFLKWLYTEVAEQNSFYTAESDVAVYTELPFYAKFLGDGVMFLWKTEGLGPTEICNIVAILQLICASYEKEFLPTANAFVDPPKKLRCGIARGTIVELGDNNDFVGPSINLASRLQLGSCFTFAFSNRGFSLEHFNKSFQKKFLLIRTNVRGIGKSEVAYVLKSEFEQLPAKERKLFEEI